MIRPNDVPSEAERELLKKVEVEIDDYLLANFKGGKLRIYSSSLNNLKQGLRYQLFEKYRLNGWIVYFDTDTVDGLPDGPYFSDSAG